MSSKLTIKGLLSIAALLFAAQAQAIAIVSTDSNNNEDVGSIDEFLDAITKTELETLCADNDVNGLGESCELFYANHTLGASFTSLDKTETVGWYETTGAPAGTHVIAFALTSGPGYYLLKNADNFRVLFRNLSDIGWGAIDLNALSELEIDLNLGNDMVISHVSEFGETTTEVPEPGTLGLLGIAALGLGLVRRRKV